MSKLLDFLRGNGTTNGGTTLEEILSMSDAALDALHDWVQWAFPLQEYSSFNVDAPIPTDEEIRTIRTDPFIQVDITRLYHRFLSYLGLTETDTGRVETGPNFEERRKAVWSEFNHNYLRVTRFLSSLQLVGMPDRSRSLYEALIRMADAKHIHLSDNSRMYWMHTQG